MENYQGLAATGATASLILNQVGPKLDKRMDQIIGEAIAAFRTMALDEKQALRYWAVLSEVAALKEQLTHEEDVGATAYTKLMEGTSNG
jgi:hypothetical protein